MEEEVTGLSPHAIEKISVAEKRIEELELLIKHWREHGKKNIQKD
tara:strand:- start:1410 stop:1544 length:135 start_codon:yes stop_codon:yes gene_type:complete